MRNRQHRKLPLPQSFKPQPREHWLDRHEREAEEREEELRRRVFQPSGGPAENSEGRHD